MATAEHVGVGATRKQLLRIAIAMMVARSIIERCLVAGVPHVTVSAALQQHRAASILSVYAPWR